MLFETARLALRCLTLEDAPFILTQLNEPSFIEHIADRGVRTLDDARRYLETGPLASYARHGHGLWLAVLKASGTPIGLCGLLLRDTLDAPDLGYALLPAYWGQGYATEAAAATLDYGRRVLGLGRILAFTSLDNDRSIKLLKKLGFTFERLAHPVGPEPVMLFASAA